MAKKFKQGPFSIAMAGSYAAKSGMGTDEIMALLTDGEDHWYTATEALDAGLIDDIGDALPVAAQYKQAAACRYQSFPNKGI